MVLGNLEGQFEKCGYFRVSDDPMGIVLYQKQYESKNEYLFLIDDRKNRGKSVSDYQEMIQSITFSISQRELNISLLTIILTNRVELLKELASTIQGVWFVDDYQRCLMIYESQELTYSHLKKEIEHFLEENTYGSGNEGIPNKNLIKNWKLILRKIPVCSCSIVVVNVLVYLVLQLLFTWEEYYVIVERFGLDWNAVLSEKEYYRLITSIFLHSGVDHLANNMLVAYFIGQVIEKIISKPRFIILYFCSGIFAGIGSLLYNMINQRDIVCIGASGAIYGLVGAMLYIVLLYRGRIENISRRQMALFIILSFYGGFVSSNVDNVAHIAGFLAGFFIAILLVKRNNHEVREV